MYVVNTDHRLCHNVTAYWSSDRIALHYLVFVQTALQTIRKNYS